MKKPIVKAPPLNPPPPVVAQIQATAMVQRVALGKTISEIAAEFRCDPVTVRKRLQLARDSGILEQAQALILEKLVPLAVAAYAHMLQNEAGDAKLRMAAAKDVLFGVGALETKSSSTVVHQADANTLEAFRQERERQRSTDSQVVDAIVEDKHAPERLGP